MTTMQKAVKDMKDGATMIVVGGAVLCIGVIEVGIAVGEELELFVKNARRSARNRRASA